MATSAAVGSSAHIVQGCIVHVLPCIIAVRVGIHLRATFPSIIQSLNIANLAEKLKYRNMSQLVINGLICTACGGSCSYEGRPNKPCWGSVHSIDGTQEGGHYCDGHHGIDIGESYEHESNDGSK